MSKLKSGKAGHIQFQLGIILVVLVAVILSMAYITSRTYVVDTDNILDVNYSNVASDNKLQPDTQINYQVKKKFYQKLSGVSQSLKGNILYLTIYAKGTLFSNKTTQSIKLSDLSLTSEQIKNINKIVVVATEVQNKNSDELNFETNRVVWQK